MMCLEQINSQKWKLEWWFPGAGERRKKEQLFNVYRVSVWGDEKVMEMGGGDVCTTL